MKMNIAKKTVAAIMVGAVIVIGAATPFIVNAAQPEDQRPAAHARHIDPQKAATEMAQSFGIDQATVLKYNAQGIGFRDIGRGAFLSLASGKSLDDIMAMKTPDTKWRDVAKTLGITRDQMKSAHQTVIANRLNAKLGIEKEATLNLARQGYKAPDIAMANLLAGNTGKSVEDILGMKKINNTWRDVATSLGVDKDTQKDDLKQLRTAFPGKFHHGGPKASY